MLYASMREIDGLMAWVLPNWLETVRTVGDLESGPGGGPNRQPARPSDRRRCVNARCAWLSLFHFSSSGEGARACGSHGSAHMAVTECRRSMVINRSIEHPLGGRYHPNGSHGSRVAVVEEVAYGSTTGQPAGCMRLTPTWRKKWNPLHTLSRTLPCPLSPLPRLPTSTSTGAFPHPPHLFSLGHSYAPLPSPPSITVLPPTSRPIPAPSPHPARPSRPLLPQLPAQFYTGLM